MLQMQMRLGDWCRLEAGVAGWLWWWSLSALSAPSALSACLQLVRLPQVQGPLPHISGNWVRGELLGQSRGHGGLAGWQGIVV